MVGKVRALAVGLSSWIFESLSPLGLINSLVPKDGYHKHGGLSYGAHRRQRLDTYVPTGDARDLPVVVFFYGGSWQSGRRQDYLFVAQALTARGCIAVIPDYRVYPEVRFPAFIEDGASAVAWVHSNVSGYPELSRRAALIRNLSTSWKFYLSV